jgi:hypothetical protein
VLIRTIDRALERLVRESLPFPEDVGDVSFETPERSWGSQLSRVTVNLFLFAIHPSDLPPRPQQQRVNDDGRIERRAPLPMVRLGYIATAWAGDTAGEHQLLGEVLAVLATTQALPPDYLPEDFPGVVQVAMSQHEGRKPGDLWAAMDNRPKANIEFEVTVPVTSVPWELAPPAVERIAGIVAPRPAPEEPEAPRRGVAVTREPDGTLVAAPAE